MFQQPLLQELIVNESDNISDDNNSDNEPDSEDLHSNAVLKGLKLPRSKEEWDSANTHFKNNMAIPNDIKQLRRNSTAIQSSIYEYLLENFGSHENSNEEEFSVKYSSYSKNRLKKALKTFKNDEESDLSELTYASRLLRSKLSKGGKPYQPNLDYSYKTRKNFWSYCKEMFESEPVVQPSFDRSTSYSYFKDSLNCKNKTRNFELPSWIVSMEPPSAEFDLSLLQHVKIAKAVKRMKSSASPCPFDHTSILVFKNCPILRTYLQRIINKCWLELSIPGVWKNSFAILIYKKGESSDPSNFRPITLEPVCMKILSSIIGRRLCNFLIKNNYVESDILKGFGDNVPGTIEHNELLTYMINHARKRQRDLFITLIDLHNAFGEVHHSLLNKVLEYHYVPSAVKSLIQNMHKDFYILIETKRFITDRIKVERRVLQGDCLSPLLFNMCFNTLIQTIKPGFH